jgi:hypothetical protein
MHCGVSPRVDPPPPHPPQAQSLKTGIFAAALGVAFIILASGALPPGAGAHSVRNSLANIVPLPGTSGFDENYNLSVITLPNFASLSGYLHNYRVQYPTIAFAGACSGALLYIDTSARMDCFNP